MKSPLVTVIIPAHNAARHIRETLDSIRAQTLRSFEALVVDDGSTDDTVGLLEHYTGLDPRFRLIRQSNAGVGAARNTGIRHARGDYIAPIDADDLWSPRKLDLQVARMEESGHRTGLVYCWSRHVDTHGRFLRDCGAYRVEGRLRRAMILRHFVGNASTPLFRADTLRAAGPYLTRADQSGAQGCEDWDMHIRMAEISDVRVAAEYLVGYRQSEACMSSMAYNMARSYRLVMERARARNPELPAQLYRWSAGLFYIYLSRKCHRARNDAGTLWSMAQAMAIDPSTWFNTRLFRIGLLSTMHLLTGGALRRVKKPTRPAPVPRPSLSQAVEIAPTWDLFHRIQSRRWDHVLQLQDPAVPPPILPPEKCVLASAPL